MRSPRLRQGSTSARKLSCDHEVTIDVTIGKTGFNPYRTSHFKDLGPWLASGMSKEEANTARAACMKG